MRERRQRRGRFCLDWETSSMSKVFSPTVSPPVYAKCFIFSLSSCKLKITRCCNSRGMKEAEKERAAFAPGRALQRFQVGARII